MASLQICGNDKVYCQIHLSVYLWIRFQVFLCLINCCQKAGINHFMHHIGVYRVSR